jgi:hypothetical protein
MPLNSSLLIVVKLNKGDQLAFRRQLSLYSLRLVGLNYNLKKY